MWAATGLYPCKALAEPLLIVITTCVCQFKALLQQLLLTSLPGCYSSAVLWNRLQAWVVDTAYVPQQVVLMTVNSAVSFKPK